LIPGSEAEALGLLGQLQREVQSSPQSLPSRSAGWIAQGIQEAELQDRERDKNGTGGCG